MRRQRCNHADDASEPSMSREKACWLAALCLGSPLSAIACTKSSTT